jgi:Tol biopolymer transport system component
VFVHDRQTGETTRVSVSGTGAQGDDVSEPAALSADGRFVAFTSAASNLVPGDTNQCGPKGFFRSCPDAFVHDRQTGETVRVSVTGAGAQGDGLSIAAGLSADGRHVAFTSTAPNLVPGDTNRCGSIPFTQAWGISGGLPARATGPDASSGPGTCPDAFVHDRLTGATSRISVSSSGRQGDDFSYAGALSADGRHVVFTSQASNLVPGDTNATGDVFVHDRWARRTTRVSVSSTGRQGGRESRGTALSADGRYVAFLSWASNLVPGDVNDAEDAFVHDRRTGRTVQVSVSSRGVPGDDETFEPAMSADGRTVAFASFATNLVAPRVVRCRTPQGEPYLCPHTFVHERPG